MKINIYTFNTNKEKNLSNLAEYYSKLTSKYADVKNIHLKDKTEKKISLEVIGKYFDKGYNITLSENGKEFDTIGLSEKLEAIKMENSTINFFLANAFGFTDEVERKADLTLSLSQMTFAHEMAYVILLEQLFRCLNLLAGGKYHK